MIREPAVSGTFYPSDKHELSQMIDKFLLDAKPVFNGKLKAIIVPHAGYIYSGPIAAYAYKLIKDYKKIILIGPSHQVYFYGAAYDESEFWQTPLGKVKIYRPNIDSEILAPMEAAHLQEHSVEVQIPFLQKVLKDFEILPIVTGEVTPKELSEIIVQLLDENTLLIISSDLSHYLPYKEAVAADSVTCSAIANNNLPEFASKGDACGKTGIEVVMHIAKKLGWKCSLLKYANSGDTAGDKRRVVGYASFAYFK